MNIVFDLGNVVVRWQPDLLLARLFADPRTRTDLRRELIDHEDWLALDRGTLGHEEAARRASRRSGVATAEVRRFLDAVPASLVAIPQTVALIERLATAGHKLFCLSNMQLPSIAYLEERYDFWPLFEGAVISARIGLIKPEPAIYAHLLERHRLAGRETLFIDDLDVNLAAAARFGIQPLRFENPGQCLAALAALDLLDRPARGQAASPHP